MTLALLALLALHSAASADPVSPARRCADAAAGAAVEVCLRLATEYPDDVEGIAAALRAHIDRVGHGDRALLGGVLGLLSDDLGLAAEGLAALGDQRAVQPLLYIALTSSTEHALAALSVLPTWPSALAGLQGLVTDDTRPAAVRLAAIDAIVLIGTEEAADSLVAISRESTLSAGVRRAVVEAMTEHFPSRTEDLAQVAGDGALWMASGGAWGFGYALASVGYFGQTEMVALGATTGALVGGAGGWIAGKTISISPGDAGMVSTSGLAGISSGFLVGGALDDSADGAWGGGLLGLGLGYGLGVAMMPAYDGTGRDLTEAGAIAIASSLLVSSTAATVAPGDTDALSLASGFSISGGMALGHVLASRYEIQGSDVGTAAVLGLYGLAAGSIVPAHDRSGLPLVGLSAGVFVPLVAAPVIDLDSDVQIAAGAGALHGGLLGAGVGNLLVSGRDPQILKSLDAPRNMAVAGMTGGLVAGGVMAWRNPDPLDGRDAMLASITYGFGLWQTAGWLSVSPESTSIRVSTGLMEALPTVMSAGVLAVSPAIDVPVDEQLSALSFGVWGGYIGGTGAWLGRQTVDSTNKDLRAALIGSDIGLAVGVGAVVLDAPPMVIALADAGGVGGGAIAAVTANLVSPDPRDAAVASLIGSGIGITAGAVGGSLWHRSAVDPSRSQVRLRSRPRLQVVPLALREGGTLHHGAEIRVTRW